MPIRNQTDFALKRFLLVNYKPRSAAKAPQATIVGGDALKARVESLLSLMRNAPVTFLRSFLARIASYERARGRKCQRLQVMNELKGAYSFITCNLWQKCVEFLDRRAALGVRAAP